jgi:hypothetical protein
MPWGGGGDRRPSRQHDPSTGHKYNWTVLAVAGAFIVFGIVTVIVKVVVPG